VSTPTDKGAQDINFSFKDDLNSTEFDKRMKDVAPPGVYSGGFLSKITDASVSVTPLTTEIGDGLFQIRMNTTAAVTVTVSPAAPFVVMRWTYNAVVLWFVDFVGVAASAIQEHDVILGEALYSGPTLTTFSLARRGVPWSANEQFKVVPTIASSMKAHVNGGYFRDGGTNAKVQDQDTATLVAPVTFPRIDLVVVNRFKAVEVLAGVEAATPVAVDPGMTTVLSELHMYVGQTTIEAVDIRDARSFSNGPIKVQWLLLSLTNGDLATQLASAVAGDRYWLEDGTYDLTGDLTISVADVLIRGSREAIIDVSTFTIHMTGAQSALEGMTLDSTGTNADPILDVSAAGVRIREVRMQGSNREKAVSLLSGTSDFLMEHCEIDDCYGGAAAISYGIWVNAGAGGTGIIIRNNELDDVGATTHDVTQIGSSAITDAPGMVIEGNVINQSSAAVLTSFRIGIDPASLWVIRENEINGAVDNGWTFAVHATTNVDNVHIHHNVMNGRWVVAFLGTSEGIRVENNRILISEDTVTGFDAYGVNFSGANVSKSIVKDNVIISIEGSLNTKTIGVRFGNTVQSEISGNTINLSATTTTSGSIVGIETQTGSDQLVCVGNHIIIDRNLGGSPASPITGISVSGDGVTVSANTLWLDCVNTPGPLGIHLVLCVNSSCHGNTITVGPGVNGSRGIHMVDSDFCSVVSNTISLKFGTVDLELDGSSDSNTVVANVFRATTAAVTDNGASNKIAHNIGTATHTV